MEIRPSTSAAFLRPTLDEDMITSLLEAPSSDVDDIESDYGSNIDPIEERAIDNERNSDTEQSASEEEGDDSISCSEDDVPLAYRGQFIGKDGKTTWKLLEPTLSIRTRQRNIIIHLPGTKGAAKTAKTPLEAWQCFFTNEILQKILHYTNLFIDINRGNYGRDRDTKNTTVDELKALFGLLYYAGVLKSSHLNSEELWDDEGTGVDIFRCVMLIQRFRFLLRMLRFDDKRTRRQRMEIDKLAPFRELFEFVVSKCKQNFSVGEYTTIDEMLWAFRGRCCFRQYMRNKPAKYGLKVFSLVDSRTFYVLNMEVYLGKQLLGPHQDLDQRAAPVVVRLIEPISGSNRNVTFDNWFTSFPLCKELLTTLKLTSVGTVRKNKKEIPREFLETKNRDVCSSMFGFGKNITTLVSYVPKPRKIVLVTSTMHHSKKIDESTGDQKKPEIITFYNSTKGGVDVVDEMCENYSVARKSNRWPLTDFYHLLDIVALNALVVCSWNTKDTKEAKPVRRQWLKALGKELVTPYMRTRLQGPLSKITRANIMRILKEKSQVVPSEQEEGPQKRKRCGLCDRQGNKTTNYCATCTIPVCGKHSKNVCINCLEDGDE